MVFGIGSDGREVVGAKTWVLTSIGGYWAKVVVVGDTTAPNTQPIIEQILL